MKSKHLCFLLILYTGMRTSVHSQWSAPLNISPGTTAVGMNENSGQCIAVTGDTVRIVYTDRSAAMVKIMYNKSPDTGLTWGAPVQVYSSLHSGFTAIAASGATVHVVWHDSLGSNKASFYKRSQDGGTTWEPAVCLDSVTKFWPGIACYGNLVIATLNKDLSGNTEVFIKRSLDNGSTWLPEQQISHAANRSEDPAISIRGSDVHLAWNDKRSGVMNIYYCHSSDSGATWGLETQLTTGDSYMPMVYADSIYVDVPHGINPGTGFDIWNSESADTGATWKDQQLTNTPSLPEGYPVLVRDGLKIHIVHGGSGGTNYLHSADGGLTWDASLFLSAAGTSFIDYTGCVLHIIFTNGGHVNYMRNPTGNGNCSALGINTVPSAGFDAAISPNPFDSQTTITFSECPKHATIKIVDVLGQEIKTICHLQDRQLVLEKENMKPGIYFVQITDEWKNRVTQKILIQ